MSEQPPYGPGGSGQSQDPEDVGSVAEEAAKLFGALSDWARDQGQDRGREWVQGVSGLAEQAAQAAQQVHEHLDENLRENLANGSPECRWCPVCRTIHVVRQMSPEVREHLTTAATSLLQAAAGVMAAHQGPGAGPERRQGVERIDLDDGEAWDDAPPAPGTDPQSDTDRETDT